MRTRLFILFLLFFLASYTYAQNFIYEKTFTHDNSYCRLNGKQIELEIRSYDQYTSFADSEYGEFVVLKSKNETKLLSMNNDGIGRYRLLKGMNPHCSKSLTVQLNKNTIIIFLAKENRPLGDTLTLLHLDLRTNAYKVINTPRRTKNEKIINNILEFQEAANPCESKTGSIQIDNETYKYSQKNFEPIMFFDGKEFRINLEKTFTLYHGQSYFRSSHEFFKELGASKTITTAVNFELGRKCLSLDGLSWHCTSIPKF